MDEMHMNLPPLNKDMYWNDCDARPPYTLAAADYCIPSFLGSTSDMGSLHSQFYKIIFTSDSVRVKPLLRIKYIYFFPKVI